MNRFGNERENFTKYSSNCFAHGTSLVIIYTVYGNYFFIVMPNMPYPFALFKLRTVSNFQKLPFTLKFHAAH